MTLKTFRVTARVVSVQTYEIDAATAADATEFFYEGVLVYDDVQSDDIESVVEIDVAESA